MKRWLMLAELLLVSSTAAYLCNLFPWGELLRPTITAGGDTASHYYPALVMHEQLLPSLRLTGWTMGNYCGFPIFHFYSTLPFALIALGGYLFPMQQVFKIVSLLGPVTLPLSVAYLFRQLGYRRGASAMAAVSTIPFLFQQGNSMWGGNIPSVLAGEFCHAIGLSLSFVFLGVLHKSVGGGRAWIAAAFLLAAIGLSHAFAFLGAVWFALFYVWPRRGALERSKYAVPAFLMAFLLLCFWGLPLIPRVQYTTEYSMIWRIKNWVDEVFPALLWPACGMTLVNFAAMLPRPAKLDSLALTSPVRGALLVAGAAGFVALNLWQGLSPAVLDKGGWALALVSLAVAALAFPRKPFLVERHGLMLFCLFGAAILYLLAPAAGFPDIRFIPIAQIFAGLIAADLLDWTASRIRYRLLFSSIVVLLGLAWSQHHLGYLPSWLNWNYSGYEGKASWPVFRDINDHLRGDFNDTRVVFEHSQSHNRFGSSRAFENLPLFSGRATLEGVFHQVSPNSSFVFYVQSGASEKTSGPFPQHTYTRLNPDKVLPQFQLYNVGDIVVATKTAREAYRKHPAYEETFHRDGYSVFHIRGSESQYVVPATNEPVLFTGEDYKLSFYRWFKHSDLLDIPMVPAALLSEKEASKFAQRTDNPNNLPRTPYGEDCEVSSHIEQHRITFDTTCPGRPHIVKVSYFPRWKARDGSPVHLVTPGFMMVYPESESFELYYGRTTLDWVALSMTWAGLLWAGLALLSPAIREGSVSAIHTVFSPVFTTFGRWPIPLSIVLLLVFSGLGMRTRQHLTEPDQVYQEAQKAYRSRDFDTAIRLFEEWVSGDKDTFKQATSLYQLGVSYSDTDQHLAAIRTLERLRFDFPNVNYGAGALFHLSRNYWRAGLKDKARQAGETLLAEYGDTNWKRRFQRELKPLWESMQPAKPESEKGESVGSSAGDTNTAAGDSTPKNDQAPESGTGTPKAE